MIFKLKLFTVDIEIKGSGLSINNKSSKLWFQNIFILDEIVNIVSLQLNSIFCLILNFIVFASKLPKFEQNSFIEGKRFSFCLILANSTLLVQLLNRISGWKLLWLHYSFFSFFLLFFLSFFLLFFLSFFLFSFLSSFLSYYFPILYNL